MFGVFHTFRIRGFIFRKAAVHTDMVRYGTVYYLLHAVITINP